MTTTATPSLQSYSLHPFDVACHQTSDYWIWSWGAPSDGRTVLGGTSQIASCLPLSWDSTKTYAATACPPDFTSACEAKSDRVVTCCPSARYFMCNTESPNRNHLDWFKCQLQYESTGTHMVTIVNMKSQGDTTTTMATQRPDRHLHALAVVYQTPAVTDAPSSTPTAPPSSSGGGVALGVVLVVAALALWILRRRRRDSSQQPSKPEATTAAPGPATDAPHPLNRDPPSEMQGEEMKNAAAVEASAYNYSTHPTPGHTVPGRHEMEVDQDRRTELPT
ncbi:hypothetical protein PG985_003759 [Apiospora marii]|uniref:uncharacterized protein n=1 Tax=Apiospora marii TaxID=335849 RepID=UPI0031319899